MLCCDLAQLIAMPAGLSGPVTDDQAHRVVNTHLPCSSTNTHTCQNAAVFPSTTTYMPLGQRLEMHFPCAFAAVTGSMCHSVRPFLLCTSVISTLLSAKHAICMYTMLRANNTSCAAKPSYPATTTWADLVIAHRLPCWQQTSANN